MPTHKHTTIGGLEITVDDLESAARTMIDHAIDARGKNQPSALFHLRQWTGLVHVRPRSGRPNALMQEADIVHADGQPLVKASQWLCKVKLPERVATTDLVENTARMAQDEQVSFYFPRSH